VIRINAELCNGCGACVDVCPTGALYLVEGKAVLDEKLCRECEVCLAACPSAAISVAVQQEPVAQAARLPAVQSEPAVIQVRSRPAPMPVRSRILPAVGAALTWAGREILPRLANLWLDRQTTQSADDTRASGTQTSGGRGGGRQHRHRGRGSGG